MTIPHPMSTPTHALPPSMDPYSNAYNLPHNDMHRSAPYPSLAPAVRTGYSYLAPSLAPNYYGSAGLGTFPAPALVPSGPTRYYGDHDSYSASH